MYKLTYGTYLSVLNYNRQRIKIINKVRIIFNVYLTRVDNISDTKVHFSSKFWHVSFFLFPNRGSIERAFH